MSDHPHTREAIERWQQGKINIFDALAELEDQRDDFRRMAEDLLERNGKLAVNLDRVRNECNAAQAECEEQARLVGMSAEREADLRSKMEQALGFWASLQRWLDMVQEGYQGQNRDDLCQLYMRGPFAGWSQEKMVRLADELYENSQKYPLHPKEAQHHG
jgi:chromosome segregation ATPase